MNSSKLVSRCELSMLRQTVSTDVFSRPIPSTGAVPAPSCSEPSQSLPSQFGELADLANSQLSGPGAIIPPGDELPLTKDSMTNSPAQPVLKTSSLSDSFICFYEKTCEGNKRARFFKDKNYPF